MDDNEFRDHFRAINSGISSLKSSVDNVAQGAILLTEAVDAQKELLLKMLEAITEEPPPSPLKDLLENMLGTLDTQTEAIINVAKTLEDIGPVVEKSVIRGFHQASGTTDSDGVVIE